ncbi:MAG: tRNA (adenosine(37)-N6)-dimethylallyltransferase MiaA [Phenylobacterium sp.]
MEPRIWLIAGPTASGKSALALRLAREIGAEIVNADALQLYADLRLLTARPSPEEEEEAPHHLFGTVDAAEGWSVGRWLRAAVALTREIASRGRPTVIVGGTGLYFRALTHGLAEVPDTPPHIRVQTVAEFEAMGEAAFRQRLAGADPAAEARISPADRQRLTRAWEVFAATGTSLSDWQARTDPALAPGSWAGVALDPPREALFDRCDARLAVMVEGGALDEVAALAARRLDPNLPAMKAVGYRELAAVLAGEVGLSAGLENAQRETRRYAKRQATWLRGQMADWPRIDAVAHEDQWRQFLALHPALTG